MQLTKWEEIDRQIDTAKDINTLMKLKESLEAKCKIFRNQLKGNLKVKNKVAMYRIKIESAIGKMYKEFENKNKYNAIKNKNKVNQINFVSEKKILEKELNLSKVSLNKYAKEHEIIENNPNVLEEIMEKCNNNEKELSSNLFIRENTKSKQEEFIEKIKLKNNQSFNNLYDVIVIDPPWDMVKIDREVTPEQTGFDYPTMSIDEIKQMKLPAENDCHLFLWTTQKYLPCSFDIIKYWDFKYVLTFVWHKNGGFQPFGLPQYNCEFCVYARKGSPKFIDLKDFFTCFNVDRTKHSEKPDKFYDTIKRVTIGKRIEIFSRKKREGFEIWGNEV